MSEPEPARRVRVLFVSKADAARSRIAAAWLHSIGGDRFDAQNAGTDPSSELDPDARQVMHEVGIDLPVEAPRSLRLRAQDYDLMIVLRP
ncbi:MAG: phosphotyrosine protein phosphatase, partial [Chloroflexi bacterium]|nr:phosphotyrosine protein phosphatase [Chloroflexota bacterium]